MLGSIEHLHTVQKMGHSATALGGDSKRFRLCVVVLGMLWHHPGIRRSRAPNPPLFHTVLQVTTEGIRGHESCTN